MDWINEKIGQIQKWVKNLPLKQSLMLYLLFGLGICFLCTWITETVCTRWIALDYASGGVDEKVRLLDRIRRYSMYGYMTVTSLILGTRFYASRLKRPAELLKKATVEIQNQNLDFAVEYESQDEMGQLSRSFDEMRKELIANKEQMWNLIEEQKKVNAAFAHDLRTPLTVLKGYSDFLYRYIPEGKISQTKLLETLRLMSEHIGRLERYSFTMKNVRNLDEIQPEKKAICLLSLKKRFEETVDVLNQIGDVTLQVTCKADLEETLYADETIILEVAENLLSNAIRYASSEVRIILEIEKKAQMLYLYVKDDGPGFSKKEISQAASPYFYEKKKQEEGEHFGIGLYIASALCQKCGGTLSIANGTDGGAFVSVSFSYRKS